MESLAVKFLLRWRWISSHERGTQLLLPLYRAGNVDRAIGMYMDCMFTARKRRPLRVRWECAGSAPAVNPATGYSGSAL